jgi:hypothetical protein
MHGDYTTPVNSDLCHSHAGVGETRVFPRARHDLDQPCPRPTALNWMNEGKSAAAEFVLREEARQATPKTGRVDKPVR